ncbi:hypothetical protein GH714_003742 [Hevea brasiliensis]|uniref:Trans-cinnamate 4-monooxygenase n=1 Tax=Hevea brasiliensis TaxID=3981 RepID=A0A6A6KMD9_HEVBR|nr:hypothetical protein GH714_003742 [Hevea brasiliensis]
MCYIVENINVAAIETTLWSMEWAIAELANNPTVQRKIRDEISAVLKGNPVTESNLHELPYLQATVKETLRLHTPIPLLVPHMNLEEAKLGGFTIPRESKVVVNAWWLANNPQWWKNPEEFRPERFFEEECGTEAVAGGKVDFRYLPFGMGRRSCPGIILALPILGLVISKLVSNFEMKAPSGTRKIDEEWSPPNIANYSLNMKNRVYLGCWCRRNFGDEAQKHLDTDIKLDIPPVLISKFFLSVVGPAEVKLQQAENFITINQILGHGFNMCLSMQETTEVGGGQMVLADSTLEGGVVPILSPAQALQP